MGLKAKVSTGSYGPFYWTEYDLVGHPRTRIVVQADMNAKEGPDKKPFWYIYFITPHRSIVLGGSYDREEATRLVRKFMADAPQTKLIAYAFNSPILGDSVRKLSKAGLKGGILAMDRKV